MDELLRKDPDGFATLICSKSFRATLASWAGREEEGGRETEVDRVGRGLEGACCRFATD